MSAGEATRSGRMFFVQDGSNRQHEGVVVGATSQLISVEFDAAEVLPGIGAEVHFAVDGRLLHTVVHQVDGQLVTLVCPAGVELRDVPDTLPARSGFSTTCRAADGTTWAAWVMEMSVRDVRLLAVRDDRLRRGQEVVVEIDGRRVRCTIDEVASHRHPEHAIYRLSFSLADAAATPSVSRLLGALRSTTSAHRPRFVPAFAAPDHSASAFAFA